MYGRRRGRASERAAAYPHWSCGDTFDRGAAKGATHTGSVIVGVVHHGPPAPIPARTQETSARMPAITDAAGLMPPVLTGSDWYTTCCVVAYTTGWPCKRGVK